MAKSQLLLMLLVISARVVLLVHGQSAADTMAPSIPITNGQTLVSAGGAFELGFFSPNGSGNHYVGIWFNNMPEQTIVWVANRDAPLSNAAGALNLTADGNLSVVNSTGHTVWSTNTSKIVNPVVRLLDTGNLVLTTGGDSSLALWQSFDHPCNTFIAGMKIGIDFKDNIDRHLNSWKSPSDPSPGNYYFGMERRGVPEIFTWDGETPFYRLGPWTGAGFTGRPNTNKNINGLFQFHYVMNDEEVGTSFTVLVNSTLTLAVLDENGMLLRMVWTASNQKWTKFWGSPDGDCDHYATCGANSICTVLYTPSCDCLQGFVPKSKEEWDTKQFSSGCLRHAELNCSSDGFLKLQNLKLPDTLNATMDRNKNLDECKEQCKRNCSCVAYVVTGDSVCMMWFGNLMDLRSFTAEGDDLYIRLAASEIETLSGHGNHRKALMIILIPLILSILLITSVGFLFRLKMKKKTRATTGKVNLTSSRKFEGDELDLYLFDILTIKAATKEFSPNNIIGEGGFGVVYKGQLDDGQEIAIKRLSEDSAQGPNEFKTEALLIAKLQHRNLVRLLGYCAQDDERILIYEYMENKSLDAFVFDQTKRTLLSWQKRLDIITGIARGLLYLHQDSRLKIIHRDLKTSNILLDREMNPKISDFGTARIVKIDQKEGNTSRVIGTYGYMSPEYAMDGIFSTKSDVFSFGVITLEVISGKKNGALSRDDNRNSLVGHAWKLWKEFRSLELVDAAMGSFYSATEVLRCIQVGLLCVQEGSDDRPTMADVVLMLSSEDVALPEPNQPGFSKARASLLHTSYYSDEIPLTVLEGR